MDDRLSSYASFDASVVAFRARLSPERVDFYTGATGESFCSTLPADTVLAVDGELQAGRLRLHDWQARDIKERLGALRRARDRRARLSVLAR